MTEAINTARAAGVSGLIVVRADAAFYSGSFVAACRRHGAHYSITAPMKPTIRRAIADIDENSWSTISYPNAIYDEQSGQWISDAEIAEISLTAFATTARPTPGRLIVRRVRKRNSKAQDQGELFAAYRYHAVFTDSPFPLVQAESFHRGHAIIEQVFADLFDGPLAHLPSGRFTANAAWLQLAAIAHALTLCARCTRLTPARAGPRHHYPHPTHQSRRPTRPGRARHPDLASATRLALRAPLAQRVSRHPPRTTGTGSLKATQPFVPAALPADPRTTAHRTAGRPGQLLIRAHQPAAPTQHSTCPPKPSHRTHRWIQAQCNLGHSKR